MSQDKPEETMKPDVPDQAAIAEANQFLENLKIGDNAGTQDPDTNLGQAPLAEVASAPNFGSTSKKNKKKKKKAQKAPKAKAKKAQNAENLGSPQEPEGQRSLSVPELTTYDKGLQTRREVLGSEHVDRSLSSNANAFSRPMQDLVTEWAWGNVWNREGLNRQQRSLLNIGLLTALNRTPELAVHIRGAINNGLSELEIREAIIHSTVYCGAPAGMEATRTAERVLREMEEKGEHKRVLV
ncbi:AhpD-like protein [Aspergillus floccosus]